MRVSIFTVCMSILFLSISGQATEKIVSIGLASNFSELSTSSSNPFGGYFKSAIMLALKESEARLEKKNIKIKIEEFDYGTSDVRVLEAAKKAAESDVISVLGYNFSSHALLAAPIHQQAKLPLITPSATANRIGSLGSYVHQGCFENDFMGETLAKVASQRLKAKKAAIVVAADCAYCTDLAKAFETQFTKNGGTISVSIPVLQDDKDFTSVYNKLKNTSFDVVLVPNQELVSARIIETLGRRGIRTSFLGGDGWGNIGQKFFGILKGIDLQGYSVSHWHPDDNSIRSKKFVSAYEKEFGKQPNDTAVLAYDSMLLLIEALLKAKEYTRTGMEEALNTIDKFEGVTGRFVFQKDHAPRKSIVLLAASNLKFKVVERIDPSQGNSK